MLKITFMMRRKPGMTREEFQHYYRKVHTRAAGPDATDILKMRRYVQLHALPEDVVAGRDQDLLGRGPSLPLLVPALYLRAGSEGDERWRTLGMGLLGLDGPG